MTPFPFRMVTVDIDGTLTQGHGWKFLAERTGRLQEYEATTRQFFAHEVDEDRHLRALLDLANGLREGEVDEILSATPKIGGISEAVEALQAGGATVALLSHNPGFVCDWYRRRFGFDDGEGTSGSGFVVGRVHSTGPVRADKLGGLARLLRRHAVDAAAVLHVGDGWADARVFPRVGGGIALNSRLPEVEAAADLALRTDDLRTVVDAAARLTPRRVVNGERSVR